MGVDREALARAGGLVIVWIRWLPGERREEGRAGVVGNDHLVAAILVRVDWSLSGWPGRLLDGS